VQHAWDEYQPGRLVIVTNFAGTLGTKTHKKPQSNKVTFG